MATINTHSELIHLFIDGEATETERNTLFGALKDSPELQEEFSSAMELKKAFAADIMQLQPPTYLQSQIAERAGLIVAASASVATAPVVVNSISSGISSMLSTAAPVATTVASKGLIALAIGTSVGILSTIGVIKMTSNNDGAKTTPVAPQAIVRQMQPVAIPQALIQVAAPASIDIAQGTVAKNMSRTISNELPAISQISKKENTTPIESKVQDVKDNAIVENIPSEPKAIVNNNDNAPVVQNANAPLDILSAITPIEAHIPVSKAIGDNGTNRGIMYTESMYDEGTTGIGRVSLRLNGIATSRQFQGQQSTLSASNNYGLAVKYDFDASNAIGVEYGHEAFPLYLSNGNGGFDNYQSIYWVGASWTYTAVYLDIPLGIHPEFRGLVAESNAGPIMKFSAGLILPLTPRLSFSMDGEETMLPINSNGANLVGNKLALTAAFTFHF